VLCREGDPAGPMYVICSGSVRAYRRSLTVRDSMQELARLGRGDVVGELAPMLHRLRSATVQALEPTEVLEIAPDQLRSLARHHQSLLRVIAVALRDRAGLDEEEIDSAAIRAGVIFPVDTLSATPTNDAEHPMPVPPHDPTVAYPNH
jgi:CRP/FNR family transcriptional regulator, cyclic AMP receptor protein